MSNTHDPRFLTALRILFLIGGLGMMQIGANGLTADVMTGQGSTLISATGTQWVEGPVHGAAAAMPAISTGTAFLIGMLLILAGLCTHALIVLHRERIRMRLKMRNRTPKGFWFVWRIKSVF